MPVGSMKMGKCLVLGFCLEVGMSASSGSDGDERLVQPDPPGHSSCEERLETTLPRKQPPALTTKTLIFVGSQYKAEKPSKMMVFWKLKADSCRLVCSSGVFLMP